MSIPFSTPAARSLVDSSAPAVFWKSARPDGTDWFSATIDYGHAVTTGTHLRLPEVASPQCASSSVLHAATEITESLWGPGLPARLFVLTGTPVVQEWCVAGFFDVAVVEEIDPTLGLGPQAADVLGLIEQARQLTSTQALAIAKAYETSRDTPGQQIGDARRAVNRAKITHCRMRAVSAGCKTAVRAVSEALGGPAPLVWRAAEFAVLGTVMRDVIDRQQAQVLTGPWESVMGPTAALPQPPVMAPPALRAIA